MLFLRLSLLYISIAMVVGGLIYIFSTKDALYSFLVAFFTSAIVVLASFKNYKSMVEKRLALSSSEEFDERDTIDKIDDPYNLYGKIAEIDESKSIKDIIKEEKAELKKNRRAIKDVVKDSTMAFNYTRLVAYAILVFGFFALLKSNNLNMLYYLATLAIPNIVAVIFLLNQDR